MVGCERAECPGGGSCSGQHAGLRARERERDFVELEE